MTDYTDQSDYLLINLPSNRLTTECSRLFSNESVGWDELNRLRKKGAAVSCEHAVNLSTHLLFVDDVDACLDVGEGVWRGEDGLAFELFVQVAVRPPVQRERGAVDEAPQVVVLVEVSDAVLHLVRVKVRLHIRDLDEGLRTSREGNV